MCAATNPLLATRDELLIGEVLRLAAAAGVQPEVVDSGAAALGRWASSSAILVGADLVDQCAAAAPPRRDRVYVLHDGPAPLEVLRGALQVGAESAIDLHTAHAWLLEFLSNLGEETDEIAVVVAVLGGAGGVGASVFAAALASAAAAVGPTLLVDADPMGAGLDRILGLEVESGIRWDALVGGAGRLSGRALRDSLPGAGNLRVLTFPVDQPPVLATSALREVLAGASRGFDTVVIDLARRADEITEEVLARSDELVVVAGLSVPGVTAAARLCQRLPLGSSRRHLVTRGRGTVPAEEVSRLLGLPLLAEMTDQRGLDEAIDLGAGPLHRRRGPLARTARQVAEVLIGR